MKTGERIGILAAEKGINLRQLAIKAEIPYNTLYALVKRKSDRVSTETLHQIAKALEVPEFMLYGEAETIDISVELSADIATLYALLDLIEKSDKVPAAIKLTIAERMPDRKKVVSALFTTITQAKYGSQYDHWQPEEYQSILNALKSLNDLGISEAVKRVEELTEIPRYQKEKEPPQDT